MPKPVLIVAFLLIASAGVTQTAQQRAVDPDMPSVLVDVPNQRSLSSRLSRFNAGASITSVHDSPAGWYTLATPALVYNFSRHYSMDLSMPVYLYRLAESDSATASAQQPTGPQGPPPPPVATTSQLSAHQFDPGDIFWAAHAYFASRSIGETFTPSMTLPSGDTGDGLSTGRVTFDLDSHSTLRLRRSALLLGLGGGNSTSLFNRLVTRNYTSLGYLAHFQLGGMIALPLRGTFEAVAYEQLPLGDSKIYTTLPRPGFPGSTGASGQTTVVSGPGVSEDNGFTNSLSVPLTPHWTLQGYYNRSLRLKTDSVGMGITYVARGQARRRRQQLSYYDQLLKQ
ncbi:MAG: hypothetical protein ACLQM6_02610 [Acidobacteriaceae bacterium]